MIDVPMEKVRIDFSSADSLSHSILRLPQDAGMRNPNSAVSFSSLLSSLGHFYLLVENFHGENDEGGDWKTKD